MSEFDKWDEGDAASAAKTEAPTPPPVPRLKILAEALLAHKEQIKTLEKEAETVSAEIAANFPDTEGEHTKIVDDVAITVTLKPNWKWDSEKLEAKFAGAALPDHIKRRLSIARDAFEALSATDQATLRDALNIEMGTPRIRIKKQETT